MSILDRLFSRHASDGPPLDVAALQEHFRASAVRRAGRAPDRDLVRARAADACRDAGLTPPTPPHFDLCAAKLDEEGWRRLALAVAGLDVPEVRAALPELPAAQGKASGTAAALAGLALETPLLTMELLRDSALRSEEFARQFVVRLGATVRGESPKGSRQRLERLDYGRLLAEAEQAKQAAEGRVQRLRELQDEQERRRPRRGKW